MKLRNVDTTGEIGRATPGESAVGSGTRDTFMEKDLSTLRDWKDISLREDREGDKWHTGPFSKPVPPSDPGVNPLSKYGSNKFLILIALGAGYILIK